MKSIALIAWLCISVSVEARPPSQGNPLKTLDSEIASVELTAGTEGIGGASIEDVVLFLRQLSDFPICIEQLDYDRARDGLTLAEALNQLRELKTKGPLAALDETRLNAYEQMAVAQRANTLIGFKKKTFKLVQKNVSVRTLLNKVTELDSDYTWKNYGSDASPLVVIQPKQTTVLDWPVPAICGSPEELSARTLYGVGGRLTLLFQGHSISRLEIRGSEPRDLQLPVCQNQLVARDVLNLTIRAAGNNQSWSLAGIKGLRWLTFQ